MKNLVERFLRYVAVETTADPNSDTQPSSKCQLNLLKKLRDELHAMGVHATLDEYGYVMGTIPSPITNSMFLLLLKF